MITSFSPDPWPELAERIVEDVGVQPGELVLIHDHAGDRATLDEVMLAVEAQGGTPLPEITTPAYVSRLLARASLAHLEKWDTQRTEWMRSAHRIIVLAGGPFDLSQTPADARMAWEGAIQRLTRIEDERRIPYVLVALPVPDQAQAIGMSVEELRAVVLPALAVSPSTFRAELEGPLSAALTCSSLTFQTGEDCLLQLRRDGRHWHIDDGIIDSSDCANGGHVANLPAGAIYTTVLEDAAEGDLWLPEAGPARDVRFYFKGGRVGGIEAREGATELQALFDNESGESRRISHIGIGFNPRLPQPIGWTLVDEHVHGALLVAFGENRYLGGQNASSLNIDFASTAAAVQADGYTIVEQGKILGS